MSTHEHLGTSIRQIVSDASRILRISQKLRPDFREGESEISTKE